MVNRQWLIHIPCSQWDDFSTWHLYPWPLVGRWLLHRLFYAAVKSFPGFNAQRWESPAHGSCSVVWCRRPWDHFNIISENNIPPFKCLDMHKKLFHGVSLRCQCLGHHWILACLTAYGCGCCTWNSYHPLMSMASTRTGEDSEVE